jgi:hypothetical protein
MRPTLLLLVSVLGVACSDPASTPAPVRLDASTDVARDVVSDAPLDIATPDVSTVDAQPVDAAPSRLRVLFVGNSYTYVNDLPAVVTSIARASRGPAIDAMSVTVGGATMRSHWDGNTAPTRIAEATWDAVVLQGQSVEPALNFNEFRTYATRFGMLATMNGARAVFYATWPRRAGDAVYAESWSGGTPALFNDRLDLAYTRVSTAVMGTVAHVGNAWMAALRAHPTINLYDADGSHPSPAGTWLAACVMYRALTGVVPPPSADDAATIPSADARALRETAAMQTP